jgi:hypothetical protein
MTLRGPRIADEFKAIVETYVASRYAPHAATGVEPSSPSASLASAVTPL